MPRGPKNGIIGVAPRYFRVQLLEVRGRAPSPSDATRAPSIHASLASFRRPRCAHKKPAPALSSEERVAGNRPAPQKGLGRTVHTVTVLRLSSTAAKRIPSPEGVLAIPNAEPGAPVSIWY